MKTIIKPYNHEFQLQMAQARIGGFITAECIKAQYYLGLKIDKLIAKKV